MEYLQDLEPEPEQPQQYMGMKHWISSQRHGNPHTSCRYRINIVRWTNYALGERGSVKNCHGRWIELKKLDKQLLDFGREDPAFNAGWLFFEK